MRLRLPPLPATASRCLQRHDQVSSLRVRNHLRQRYARGRPLLVPADNPVDVIRHL